MDVRDCAEACLKAIYCKGAMNQRFLLVSSAVWGNELHLPLENYVQKVKSKTPYNKPKKMLESIFDPHLKQ